MANALTALRLLAVVPAAWAFSRPVLVPGWLLAALMTVAIVTDVYDGRIARTSGTASGRGMLFDHTTDFLFVTSGLAAASLAGLVPPLLPVLIVVAFTQYVWDSYFLHRRRQLRVSTLGRWNGILYFAPLVQIAMSRLEWLPVVDDLAGALVRPLSMVLVFTTMASIVDRALAPVAVRADAR